VRVAVLKLEGVESVQVSLERAVAEIRLARGNRMTLSRLRQLIKDNGFTSKEAGVTAFGTLIERDGNPAISVAGTDMVWLLTPDPQRPEAHRTVAARLAAKQAGTVECTGVLSAASGPNQPDTLTLHTIAPRP
jgi:hypothetical protein